MLAVVEREIVLAGAHGRREAALAPSERYTSLTTDPMPLFHLDFEDRRSGAHPLPGHRPRFPQEPS